MRTPCKCECSAAPKLIVTRTAYALKNSFLLFMGLLLVTLTVWGKDVEARTAEPLEKADSVPALPKLVDLGAKKCIPCKRMAPILDELAKEYKGMFDVEFIDVWQPENKEKAKAHAIASIPTQIFFDASGKELWRHEGFISKEDILKKWKELGFTFNAVQQKPDLKKPEK